MTHSPAVCAIVLNWNGWKDTLRCVESLRHQDYDKLDVLVVDNGSRDASLAQFKGAGIRVLALPENLGFAGGMNRGIELALSQGVDYVLLLNNDAYLERSAVSLLVSALEARSSAGMAAPTIYYHARPDQAWYAGGSLSRWTGTAKHGTSPGFEPREVTFATGCCLLIRRQALSSVGLLNERYFLYFEDVEFCDRLLAQGLSIVYVPQAKAWHDVGGSTGSQLQKAPPLDYFDTRNGLWFIRERLHGFHRWNALLYFALLRLPRKVLRILLSSPTRRQSLSALYRGLRDTGRPGAQSPLVLSPLSSPEDSVT